MWRAFSSRGTQLAVLSLLGGLIASGCVTRATHQALVKERDGLRREQQALEERTRLLSASNESLTSERVRVIEELEDLRQDRDALQATVTELEGQRTELTQQVTDLEQRASELERTRASYDELVLDLERELEADRLEIDSLREGLRMSLPGEVLFQSGSAELKAAGAKMLADLAARLRSVPDTVEVQGHTDDRPLRPSAAFASNWELAGARAARVVALFQKHGIAEARLRAVSFGSVRPLVSNDDAEGRARNRRIEIRLIPAPPADSSDDATPGDEGSGE